MKAIQIMERRDINKEVVRSNSRSEGKYLIIPHSRAGEVIRQKKDSW